MAESAYIEFVESHDPSRKTRIWNVLHRGNRERLGEVRFWPGWRKYVFFPADETLWDSFCLQVIQAFLTEQTNAWKVAILNGR